jgi:ABC-type multidrug transport system fused ATPase/permease subunit
MASKFDRVIVLEEGRLAEQGSFDELDKDGTALRSLLESA